MRVVVTGANGFVGQVLCGHLESKGHSVVRAVRQAANRAEVAVGDIGPQTHWNPAFTPNFSTQDSARPVDAVVHLAARVHMMHDKVADPVAEFCAVNTEGTLNLARQAVQAGVKRFIFISTVKVNGEGRDAPYRETDEPCPEDAYAISKWEAEQGLQRIARDTGLEVVVLRPPLVYGPGVKANFLRLMRIIQQGWPLPLGAVRNRRSLLYLGNFVDAIRVCLEHPSAAGQTFLLDDGKPVSTPELIRTVAAAMKRPARLIAVPVGVLELAGRLLGKQAAVARLTGSLYVDNTAIRSRLGWVPPFSMEAGVAATVTSFR